MSEFLDVTVPCRPGLPTWPASTGFSLRSKRWQEAGDTVTSSRMDVDLHYGTHIDAPRHFLRDGPTVDELGLERVLGPTQVVAVPVGVSVIDASVLEETELPGDSDRLLLKTANANHWPDADGFRDDYVALDESGGQWCVDRGLVLVGIDYLSIQSRRAGPETHRILMRAGVIIIEGLDLRAVEPGAYELFCLPLRLVGAEAAPARVLLRPLRRSGSL